MIESSKKKPEGEEESLKTDLYVNHQYLDWKLTETPRKGSS